MTKYLIARNEGEARVYLTTIYTKEFILDRMEWWGDKPDTWRYKEYAQEFITENNLTDCEIVQWEIEETVC